MTTLTQDQIDDLRLPVTAIDERNFDYTVQREIELILFDKPELNGLYHGLDFLWKSGSLDWYNQIDIGKALGYSENTYIKLRNELIALGLIHLEKMGRKQCIRFNYVHRLADLRKIPRDPLQHIDFYKKMGKKVRIDTPKIVEAEKQKAVEVLFDGIIVEKAKEIIKKKQEKEEKRFPNEDYEMVLNSYKKYKHVGLVGPEINRAKKAIKQMFLAQRTPKQIVDCMRFFAENRNSDEFKWLQSWTLETVMKKIPEFLGGQLKSSRMEDEYEKI